jgi:hypothetical protein
MLLLSHTSGLLGRLQVFASILLLAVSWVSPATAQVRVTSSDKVIFPAGLKWERMRTVILDRSGETAQSPMVPVRPEDVAASKRIWNDEVAKATAEGKNADFHSQITTTTYKGKPVAFSLIALPMDFERCEQASNGKDVVDVYSKCLARVAIGGGRNPHVVEFSGFCYADSVFTTPEELKFRAQTHNQFAFDDQQGIAYFRLIQHGKLVPVCNRTIKLEGLS